MNYIPNAKGLTEELSDRVSNLVIGQPTERMAPDGIHKVTRYEVSDGNELLGFVEVNSYETRGITQIEHVVYNGIVHGYMCGKRIGMTATALLTLDPSDPEYLRSRDFTRPNNTFRNPLYRHDGHSLKLADHEVDGKRRVILTEDEALKLEAALKADLLRFDDELEKFPLS